LFQGEKRIEPWRDSNFFVDSDDIVSMDLNRGEKVVKEEQIHDEGGSTTGTHGRRVQKPRVLPRQAEI
jgi:hypothetical protein